MKPQLYIIGGPNGAGKTTAAYTLLPDFLGCSEYVNADAIAAGLSPFNSDSVAIQAGRLMLARIQSLLAAKKDFAFETTLASRSFAPLIERARQSGYRAHLIFLRLESAALAKKRVGLRVASGGHSIPAEIICRRYKKGLHNLWHEYMPVVDSWQVYDNSQDAPQHVAAYRDEKLIVTREELWQQIKK